MKKLLVLGIFLALGNFALSAQNSSAVRIVNNTGYEIYYIYISPADDDYWSDDILGDDILENGQSFLYQLPQPINRVNVYDICLEDEDGDWYIKWNVTVTNNARIVFTVDDLEED